MKQPATSTTPRTPSFYEHLQGSIQTLRVAIIELLGAVGADPGRPQDVARRFGLNKNLTWKISKIVGGQDPYATVPHIPGPAGVEIFLKALAKAGGPADLVEAVRRAAAEFDEVVKVHTGDRRTLEIMVNDRLPAGERGDQDELNRKRAFQGNSGIWGVRARTILSFNMLAPNADDPQMADLVQVAGLERFRRLRPDARWLLCRRERWSDDDPRPARDAVESLDPDFPVDDGLPLLGAFCSRPIPDIDVIEGAGEDQYELPPGAVGNTAAFTCIHGQVARRVGPVHGEAPGEFSEIGNNLITPAEHLVFDLLVHRDFDWAMNPELLIYGRVDGGPMQSASRRERNVLPTSEPVHDLGVGTAGLATPLLPRYTHLVGYVFDRLGWSPDAFRAFRFTMTYPPIPTVVLYRSELPVR